MIEIRINNKTLDFSVRYSIDSVVAETYVTNDKKIALIMVGRYMDLEKGLAKGKQFTCQTGKEI